MLHVTLQEKYKLIGGIGMLEKIKNFFTLKHKFKDKEIDEDKKNVKLEKNDFLAMMIALGITIFPVVLLIFAFLALIIWIIF